MGAANTWNPYAPPPVALGQDPKLVKAAKPVKRAHSKPKFHGPLYNLEEACTYLGGLSATYIRQLVADNKLRRCKIKGRSGSEIRNYLFAQSELDRFISISH